MRTPIAVTALLFAVVCEGAEPVTSPSIASPPDEIRIWGNPQTTGVVARWAQRFREIRPTVRISPTLTGSDIGMAGLYTSQADIALLGREATDSESKAYEWVFRFKPAPIAVMTGSLDRPGHSPAVAILVHRDNPLGKLTLRQLAAIVGNDSRAPEVNIRLWGQLGLKGDWKDRAIRVYAPHFESGTGLFFRSRVLSGSTKLNWDNLTEFSDPPRPIGHIDTSGDRILEALRADRYGLAIGHPPAADSKLRALALAATEDSRFVPPTPQNLVDRAYPLTRTVFAYVHRPPGGRVDPEVAEFLRFVLSKEAQELAVQEGFLPLGASLRRDQLERL